MKHIFFIQILLLSGIALSCSSGQVSDRLQGDYLGQAPPSDTEAELFAPGTVCTGLAERDIAISPDGTEIYFCAAVGGHTKIMVTVQDEGGWTTPEVAPFCSSGEWFDIEPCISPDGKSLFFVSDRPDAEGKAVRRDGYIWVMDRTENGWSEPERLAGPVNGDGPVFFPSLTRDRTLYFTRGSGNGADRTESIWRSRFVDGEYAAPERLPENVNSARFQYNAFISPDESYIIVPVAGRDDGYGGTDYYISYRDSSDRWSRPLNLGGAINTSAFSEYSPYVSPDGKYFFFMSQRLDSGRPDPVTRVWMMEKVDEAENGNSDIYWIGTAFIEDLKSQAQW